MHFTTPALGLSDIEKVLVQQRHIAIIATVLHWNILL